MIKINFLKPFYTKTNQNTLRLVFAYQYFSIIKDEEVFHFIPIEGKEILIDLATKEVQNLSEVFVFQRGNRFVRLPLYQLLLVSNVHEHLQPIIEASREKESIHQSNGKGEADIEIDISQEVVSIVNSLEEGNLARLIDQALTERNEEMFYKLLEQKQSN